MIHIPRHRVCCGKHLTVHGVFLVIDAVIASGAECGVNIVAVFSRWYIIIHLDVRHGYVFDEGIWARLAGMRADAGTSSTAHYGSRFGAEGESRDDEAEEKRVLLHGACGEVVIDSL